MMTRKYWIYQLKNHFDNFEVVTKVKGVKLINPWREMLASNTGRENFTRITYTANDQPTHLTRAIYTTKPTSHLDGAEFLYYYDDHCAILVRDDCKWDDFIKKHQGEDVLAVAEIDFNK